MSGAGEVSGAAGAAVLSTTNVVLILALAGLTIFSGSALGLPELAGGVEEVGPGGVDTGTGFAPSDETGTAAKLLPDGAAGAEAQ